MKEIEPPPIVELFREMRSDAVSVKLRKPAYVQQVKNQEAHYVTGPEFSDVQKAERGVSSGCLVGCWRLIAATFDFALPCAKFSQPTKS